MAIKILTEDFHYSSEELQALAESLGPCKWSKEPGSWRAILDEETLQMDDKQIIAHKLEDFATSYLADLGVSTPSSRYFDERWRKEVDMDRQYVTETYKKISTLAGSLRQLLLSRHPYSATFVDAIGDFVQLDKDEGDQFRVVKELEAVEEGMEEIQLFYLDWVKDRPRDFNGYITTLLYFWRIWTNKEPAASNAGTRTAEFLVAAINPLVRFGKANGIEIRPGNRELSMDGAALLIRRNREWEDQQKQG